MTNREGTPIWYELMTTAPDAAQDFYEGTDSGMPRSFEEVRDEKEEQNV